MILLSFVYLTRQKKLNEHYLGFERHAQPIDLRLTDSLTISSYNRYFIGANRDSVMLGNRQRPMEVSIFGSPFRDSSHITIQSERFMFSNLSILMDGKHLFLLDGNQPFIRRGTVDDWIVRPWITGTYFVSAAPLTNGTAVVMSSLNGMATLGKLRSGEHPEKVWFPGVLEKQVDGYFCSFGHLLADPKNNRVVYLYRYRNQYLVADTNMNLLYRANTIDTISLAKIKVGKLNGNTFSMSAPPLTVNLNSCIQDGKLFVHSNMRAANETRMQFLRNSPIDVYDLNDGSYRYSFYIPNRYGAKILDFRMLDEKKIVALYKDEMTKYEIHRIPSDSTVHR